MRSICLLGSTGSIGTQVLEVVRRFPQYFNIGSLACGENLETLAAQIREFQPKQVCIANPAQVPNLRTLVPNYQGEILAGPEGLLALAEDADCDAVVVGLVGMRGLAPTLQALETGKKVLTANKETFVAGGHLVKPYLSQIIPFDSEHSALFQCLQGDSPNDVRTLYLTGSGGPFRNTPLAEMAHVTRAQALTHPNWVMGPKVTIDSATMMNKGLEIIEAHWLFGLPYEAIQVVVHPQSIFHSAVEFTDGAIKAQLGVPDMRGPIRYALGYALDPPQRLGLLEDEDTSQRLDLATLGRLDFHPPDETRFPCLRLAREAGRLGSGATAVLNAADEVAVELFLAERIRFLEIPRLIEAALTAYTHEHPVDPAPSLTDIQALDTWARKISLDQACTH